MDNPITPATPAQTVAPFVEPHLNSGLSPSEASTMADWTRKDVANVKVTPEQAAKIFDQLGTPPDYGSRPPIRAATSRNLLMNTFPQRKRRIS